MNYMAKILEFITAPERQRRAYLKAMWDELLTEARNYDDWRQDIEIAEHELHQPFEDPNDE